MKLAVLGGTALLGIKLINKLRSLGHEAFAVPQPCHVTGEQLQEALTGTRAVIDVTSAMALEEDSVVALRECLSRNLIAAERAVRVRHHILLSVIGADALFSDAIMRFRAMQEHLIKQSRVPYTILHSTQFFELIGDIATSLSDGRVVHATKDVIRPIGSDDVITALAELAVGPPLNGVVRIAGPEPFRLDILLRQLLRSTADVRVVVADGRHPNKLAMTDEMLSHNLPCLFGKTPFTDWIAYSAGHAPMPTTIAA